MNKFAKGAKAFFTKSGRSRDGIFALALAMIIAVNVLLYVLVSAFGLYLYEEPKDDLSLSGNTDSLFEDAVIKGDKITVSFCMTKGQIEQHTNGWRVHETVKNFAERYAPLIDIKYINILTQRYDDPSDSGSIGEIVDLGKYKKDMRGEEQDVLKTSVIFECGESYRVITDAYTTSGFAGFYTMDTNGYATSYNGEEVVAGMLSWVLSDEHKTAYFTQHHSEAVDPAFSNLLVCAGYYVDVIDLRNEPVPDDAAMVLISNPKTDFERAAEGSGVNSEIERLKNYLNRGGKLFVTLDPYVKELPVLEEFLREYGIEFSSTKMENGKTAHNIVKDTSSAIGVDGFTFATDYSNGDIADLISGKAKEYASGKVIIRDVSALKLSGNAKPLLESSGASVLQAGGVTVNSDGRYTVAAYSKNPTPLGDAESTVLVVPSIYLAVSDTLVSREYANKDFTYALFDILFGYGKMPYGCRAILTDSTTLQGLELITIHHYTALIFAIPVILSVVGIVIIIRRRNS